MTTKTIDCVECGETAPYGRFSCPSCGALMASVAGAWRPPFGPDEPAATAAEPAAAYEPAEPAAADEPVGLTPADERDEPAELAAAADLVEPAGPVLEARPYVSRLPGPGDAPYQVAPPPGVYRPPASVPSLLAAGGSSWAVASSMAGGPEIGIARTSGSGEVSAEPDAAMAARFVEIAGWFIIVGAAMAVLGFLLPWSRVVIGARNYGGYLDAWGLASPTHIVVLFATLIILALAVVRNPVPAWLRSGVLGLAAGGLLIGLTWPYLVGPLGADVGALVVALGGSALAIGGTVTSWATRHAETGSSV